MANSLQTNSKIVKTTLAVVVIASIMALIAAPAPAQNSPYFSPQATIQDGQWRVEFAPVPSVLRMHVPGLPSEGGMLVQHMEPESAASQLGLHVGDLLLEVNGIPMNSPADLPVLDDKTRAVSVHRGKIYTLSMPMPCIYPIAPTAMGGVSATSVANGNESVSVRSIGDQHTIQMALPALRDTMIRVQGTRNQIENKILDAGLSPNTTQRVFQAMGGIR